MFVVVVVAVTRVRRKGNKGRKGEKEKIELSHLVHDLVLQGEEKEGRKENSLTHHQSQKK